MEWFESYVNTQLIPLFLASHCFFKEDLLYVSDVARRLNFWQWEEKFLVKLRGGGDRGTFFLLIESCARCWVQTWLEQSTWQSLSAPTLCCTKEKWALNPILPRPDRSKALGNPPQLQHLTLLPRPGWSRALGNPSQFPHFAAQKKKKFLTLFYPHLEEAPFKYSMSIIQLHWWNLGDVYSTSFDIFFSSVRINKAQLKTSCRHNFQNCPFIPFLPMFSWALWNWCFSKN